jgi:TRAP-type uncharacterized transport system fused permease subunit
MMMQFEAARLRASQLVAFLLVGFVLFTSAFGELTSLIQRPVFLGLIVLLGTLHFPLWHGGRWQVLGVVVDATIAAVGAAACTYIVVKSDSIMTGLPMAEATDLLLCWGLVALLLELARRTVGWIFPAMVLLMLGYTLFGAYLPEQGWPTASSPATAFRPRPFMRYAVSSQGSLPYVCPGVGNRVRIKSRSLPFW